MNKVNDGKLILKIKANTVYAIELSPFTLAQNSQSNHYKFEYPLSFLKKKCMKIH